MQKVNLLKNYPITKRNLDLAVKERTEEVRKISRKFGKDFFDGERKYGYGGFHYNPIYWTKVVKDFAKYYNLQNGSRILDVGCGKGFMLYELFNINFFSIFEINKVLIKNKAKNKKLNIIMIGSIAAFENKASIGYSAAKSVLLNYNKNLASNFIKENVICKLVIPGSFISTRGAMERLKKSNQVIFKKIEKSLPARKMQDSKDLVKFIEYLLKSETVLLNGTYISLSKLESKSIFL